MNVEEFINDPIVHQHFSRWDHSIQNRFRDLLRAINSVCDEFDSSVTQNKNSIRCGLYEKNGTPCTNHFFTFKFKKKDFGFEISCQKTLRHSDDIKHEYFRGETDPYIKFPSVNSANIIDIKGILLRKLNDAEQNNYLPQGRDGILPSELKVYKNMKERFLHIFKNHVGEFFTADEIFNKVIKIFPNQLKGSVLPSDFCYNRWNKSCKRTPEGFKSDALFIKSEEKVATYQFVGEADKYTGKITFSTENRFQNVVGEWENGEILSWSIPDKIIEQQLSNIENTHYSPLNQILYGPPGTGKTYHTIEAAVKAAEPSLDTKNRNEWKQKFDALSHQQRIRFVTFHQSYGYEEFVQGLRAETEDGQIHYKVQSGIFKKICEDATEDPDNNYVLVIDEINRGNISKIFGELITLIEDSKRKNVNDEGEISEALSLRLPYSKPEEPDFFVPTNLFIIGTMNTADRSLAAMDTALRRRFHFTEMMPDPSVFIESGVKVKGLDLVKMLTIMNQRIEFLYDREHTLGHAFFMSINNSEDPFTELKSIFKNKIIPLLEEYFFEDWEKIQLVLGDNQKAKEHQFIYENKSVNAESLFGKKSSHELNLEPQKQFKLNDGAFDLIDAYKGIYSVPQSDSPKTDSANDTSEAA